MRKNWNAIISLHWTGRTSKYSNEVIRFTLIFTFYFLLKRKLSVGSNGDS